MFEKIKEKNNPQGTNKLGIIDFYNFISTIFMDFAER
jgi:hypothetical protein